MPDLSSHNLLDYDRTALRTLFSEMGEPAFRGDQVFKWLHQARVDEFALMSNLSKSLRSKLMDDYCIEMPSVTLDQTSEDGTRKFLLKLACGNHIETVFIPESTRGTLCVSSQVGCALNCQFCSTGAEGFNRNLSVAEIISQVRIVIELLASDQTQRVTNVVMMGMGEPLLNFDHVVSAMDIMMDDCGYNISKYRLTLSTAGVVPNLLKLAERSKVALAVSLHAPNDELRNQLVPINKKYPLKTLLAACKAYFKQEPKRQITMEYVMLKGVNDQPIHAKQLIKQLKGINCKMNLIPFNPFPGTQYTCSHPDTINRFRKLLIEGGLHTVTRKTRGDDIDAACGQLKGQFDRKRRVNRVERIPIEVVHNPTPPPST